MEGVSHSSGDGKMSLVVLSGATVAIFEKSDALLEEGEFPALHCEYEALVAVPGIPLRYPTYRSYFLATWSTCCV